MQALLPWLRRRDDKKSHNASYELRIATSGSFSIRATVENLKVDGAGSYSQGGRVRAALFVPATMTTVHFQGDGVKKPTAATRSNCVHVVQMFTPEETSSVLADAERIGTAIGWSDRGVSLPTQDVLVQNLTKDSQDLVHKAIRERLLPFARRQYPHLNAALDKQPYPRPGNLFIVRYSATSGRAGGRGLKLHKDETALTFNICLSPQDGFEGGGTYFPAASGDVDGILLRPTPGYCLVHDGNIKHAGNDVVSGTRYILVGFYNADGRDRAGEEAYFSRRLLEEQRAAMLATPPPPIQTIYFTTAVAAVRGGPSGVATSSTLLPPLGTTDVDVNENQPPGNTTSGPPTARSSSSSSSSSLGAPPPVEKHGRNLSSVAIQGPAIGEAMGGWGGGGGGGASAAAGKSDGHCGGSSSPAGGSGAVSPALSPTSESRPLYPSAARHGEEAAAAGGRRDERVRRSPPATGGSMVMAHAARGHAAHSRSGSTLSCMPNWPLFQLIQGKRPAR